MSKIYRRAHAWIYINIQYSINANIKYINFLLIFFVVFFNTYKNHRYLHIHILNIYIYFYKDVLRFFEKYFKKLHILLSNSWQNVLILFAVFLISNYFIIIFRKDQIINFQQFTLFLSFWLPFLFFLMRNLKYILA